MQSHSESNNSEVCNDMQKLQLLHDCAEKTELGLSENTIPAIPSLKMSDLKFGHHNNGSAAFQSSLSCGGHGNSNIFRETRTSSKVSCNDEKDGMRLNQYLLKEDLGHGAYGMVKLVYNEDDDNLYAMKILSKRKLIRQAGFARRPPRGGKKAKTPLDRVYQEIALLKKLSHPNVVKLVEVLDDPGEDSLYMVFELMEKGEILEIPTDHPLDEGTARSYFADAVLGLEYLHHHKIIHRDLKPSNLLIDDNGRVKIADLGVSQEFSDVDDKISGSVGTPAFMPPEVVSGDEDSFQGRPLDMWSLGVTLFCMTVGTTPFTSGNILQLHEEICKRNLVFPAKPDLSPELRDLIGRLLDKDPVRRISLADVKSHPWLTRGGQLSLPSEEDNCQLVTVTEEDVKTCVRKIPRLNTLILVKTMLKHHSFKKPKSRAGSGKEDT